MTGLNLPVVRISTCRGKEYGGGNRPDPISAHVPLAELLSDPDRVVSDYAEIGCKYIAVPYLEEDRRPGTDGFMQTIQDIEALGNTAKKHGIQLLYHNHDFEFEKINGEYALDVLYQSVPSELLQTEIDTCWVNVAGVNPADYIRQYSGRAPIVHLRILSWAAGKA